MTSGDIVVFKNIFKNIVVLICHNEEVPISADVGGKGDASAYKVGGVCCQGAIVREITQEECGMSVQGVSLSQIDSIGPS